MNIIHSMCNLTTQKVNYISVVCNCSGQGPGCGRNKSDVRKLVGQGVDRKTALPH